MIRQTGVFGDIDGVLLGSNDIITIALPRQCHGVVHHQRDVNAKTNSELNGPKIEDISDQISWHRVPN